MPHAGHFDEQALSNTLWAFATMSCRPSEAFVQQLLGRCQWLVADMSPQHCGNLLWAMAQLQIRAPDSLVSSFANRVLLLEPRMTAHDYAHVLFGVAAHPRPLPPTWLGAVAHASSAKLARCSPQVLPRVLRAVLIGGLGWGYTHGVTCSTADAGSQACQGRGPAPAFCLPTGPSLNLSAHTALPVAATLKHAA